jgi:hypothetical protein
MMATHRAMCFVRHGEPPSPQHQAAHSCGKGHEGCFNPNHVRWATAVENADDKRVHGTLRRGEKASGVKLTEQDVRIIRLLKDTRSLDELAEIFNVNRATIHQVVRNKTWAWLDKGAAA